MLVKYLFIYADGAFEMDIKWGVAGGASTFKVASVKNISEWEQIDSLTYTEKKDLFDRFITYWNKYSFIRNFTLN